MLPCWASNFGSRYLLLGGLSVLTPASYVTQA